MTLYRRTSEQRKHDLAKARVYERKVAEIVEQHAGPVLTRFTATDDLDIWVPGYFIEIKEKNQSYTKRWQIVPGVPEEYLFIMDELTIRRALRHYPGVFFLIRMNPIETLYLAPIWEVIGSHKVRRNRVGKGKWILDIRQFRTLEDETKIIDTARQLMLDTPWLSSGALSFQEVQQI